MAKPARHPRRGYAPPPSLMPSLPGDPAMPARAVGPGGGKVRRPRLEAEDASRSRGFVPAIALLPMRLFFGFTFLYAGIDKLVDPTFFDALAPNGIQHQLLGYVRTSPLAGLIQTFAVPHAELVGLGMALLEIAIGVGALTGILFRFAALGGALVSLLFFLTASWTVQPFYFGQDLPYMFGWITLAAAGHGDLYVLGPWLERRIAAWRAGRAPRPAPGPEPLSPERRTVLELGVIGGAALVVAGLTRPLRLLAGADTATRGSTSTAAGGNGTATATAGASSASPPTAAGAGSGTTSNEVGTVSQLDASGAIAFTVPAGTGNANVAPGDPAVLLKLNNGSIVAFDAVCTHEGCPVEFDAQSGFLACPCHGAMFDPNNKAAVVAGPARAPLPELPIKVDKATGTITLHA